MYILIKNLNNTLVYVFFLKIERKKENIITYIISNLILSLPVLSLFYWGSVISPHDTDSRKFGSSLFLEQIG